MESLYKLLVAEACVGLVIGLAILLIVILLIHSLFKRLWNIQQALEDILKVFDKHTKKFD